MDKLIFLDIDGVVNTLMIYDKPFEGNLGHISRDGFYFDMCLSVDNRVSNTQAVMWLNKLCKDTKARIVITSTWRLGSSLKELITILRNSGLHKDIIIEGCTPNLGTKRGNEILHYLQYNYPNGVYSYVILDDDDDMDGCMERLVKCNCYRGFGYPEYIKAINILNN